MSDPKEPVHHEIGIDVRYAETDQMAVVHHANYLIWFEMARTALCAQTAYSYARIENELGVWLMVSGARLTYRGGARYGDRVRVSAWVEKLRSRGVEFGYQVRRGSQRLAEGFTEHVWVDRESGKHCRMPKELEESFRELAGA